MGRANRHNAHCAKFSGHYRTQEDGSHFRTFGQELQASSLPFPSVCCRSTELVAICAAGWNHWLLMLAPGAWDRSLISM